MFRRRTFCKSALASLFAPLAALWPRTGTAATAVGEEVLWGPEWGVLFDFDTEPGEVVVQWRDQKRQVPANGLWSHVFMRQGGAWMDLRFRANEEAVTVDWFRTAEKK
jgi:hypothetical protein